MFQEVRGEALTEKAAASGYNYRPGRHGGTVSGCGVIEMNEEEERLD